MLSNWQKSLRKIVLLSLFLLLTSCSVIVPNVPLCSELAPDRGFCVTTMTSEKIDVNETSKLDGKTWWELRPYMIYMPVDSWVEIKKFIIKICKKTNKCNGQSVSNWERSVEKLDTLRPE